MDPASLRAALDRLPRVDLAEVPTPLHAAPRLAAAIGLRHLWIKRDDLTGLAFGGNKARKFRYSFAEVVRAGADCVITGAASQSNHARQAAAAAARLGLTAYLVNRYDERARRGMQGNWLLDEILGAEVRLVARREDQGRAMERLAEVLRAAGRRPYLLGERAAVLGAVAYVECFLEIYEQLAAGGATPDVVAVASASGTHAGLALGAHWLAPRCRVIAWRPSRGEDDRVAERVARMACAAAECLGLDASLPPAAIRNRGDAVGDDYGIPTAAGLDAIHLVARTEGILLDPVYTGKAFAGLVAAVQAGEIAPEERVVFVHTGGTPALFAYADELRQRGGYGLRIIEEVDAGVL